MNQLSTILISILCGTLFACSPKDELPDTQPPPLQAGETLVFEDNFTTLDFTIWNKETHEAGWVNQELQAYDYAQVTVGKDAHRSVLMLTAEHKNGKLISGRVNTRGKKNFRYGKLEASIKLPKTANGLWPAFWVMGDNNKQWPACGEIDILEMGDAEGIRSGTTTRRVNTAIHYGPSPDGHQQQYYAANAPVDLQDGSYHRYTMEWDETSIAISIDSIPFNTFQIKDNPYFHDNFYILLNLAVGGSFTGITDQSKITALKEGQKAVMYIDWIRIIDNK